MHKNFQKYIPEDPFLRGLSTDHNIAFLRDEDGVDYYDLAKTLDTNKYTVMLCKNNIVRSYDKDPNVIFPIPEGHLLQVDDLNNIDYLSKYDPETKTFSPFVPKPSLDKLLSQLKVAEIKKELGDSSVDQEITSLKRQIVDIS